MGSTRKIAILGVENSHARAFMKFVRDSGDFGDIEVCGAYSSEPGAAEKLNSEFGVPVMENYADLAGKIDGLIVTARHGDEHLKFALPYMTDGLPLFMDKPITVSEEDALRFADVCREKGIRFTGGSCCVHCPEVKELRETAAGGRLGRIVCGSVRAPLNTKAKYGGFFFYAQHLTEIMMEIFGRYPRSVRAWMNGQNVFAAFDYGDFPVFASFIEGSYVYRAEISAEKGVTASDICVGETAYRAEFDAFADILRGGGRKISVPDFIAPVFAMNAVVRSLERGGERVPVGRPEGLE